MTVVGQSFVETVADHHGHWACCLSQQALVTSFLIVSTSMTTKDPDLSKLIFCDLRLQRTLQE